MAEQPSHCESIEKAFERKYKRYRMGRILKRYNSSVERLEILCYLQNQVENANVEAMLYLAEYHFIQGDNSRLAKKYIDMAISLRDKRAISLWNSWD